MLSSLTTILISSKLKALISLSAPIILSPLIKVSLYNHFSSKKSLNSSLVLIHNSVTVPALVRR